MNAAELFVKCLEAEGVKYIFGLPGEENAHFLMALEKSPIQFVMTRHEQSRDGIDVAAVPLDGRAIGERPAEQLTVAAGGARLRIIDSAARKFNATVDRVHYSHLNLKLDEIPKDVAAAP